MKIIALYLDKYFQPDPLLVLVIQHLKRPSAVFRDKGKYDNL